MTPEPVWVDLGLPSGLLWADRNLGAATVVDIGLYYSWGNIDGHLGDGSFSFTSAAYSTTPGGALTTDVPTDQDAARIALGGAARTPSFAEVQELSQNCSQAMISLGAISAVKFTSNINGNSIVIPLAGYIVNDQASQYNVQLSLWTKSIGADNKAYELLGDSGGMYPQAVTTRYIGRSIRAVRPA